MEEPPSVSEPEPQPTTITIAIPGFPIESIIIGVLLSTIVLGVMRYRRMKITQNTMLKKNTESTA